MRVKTIQSRTYGYMITDTIVDGSRDETHGIRRYCILQSIRIRPTLNGKTKKKGSNRNRDQEEVDQEEEESADEIDGFTIDKGTMTRLVMVLPATIVVMLTLWNI